MNYIKLFIVSVIWGGTFVAGRLISTNIDPMLSSAIRFSIASIVLVLCIKFMGGIKPISLMQGIKICILGFIGIFVYNVFFFKGLQLIPASRASLIVSINPAMIALASFLILKERLLPINIFGLVISLIGVLMIINPNGINFNNIGYGDFCILMCVFSWVFYTIFSKNISREVGAFHTVTYSILVGNMLLVFGCVLTGKSFYLTDLNIFDWTAYLYLGVFGSAVAYVFYYQGIQNIGAARSGIFIGLSPVTAVLIGVCFLDEDLTYVQTIGGTLVICGVYICNIKHQNYSLLKKLKVNSVDG